MLATSRRSLLLGLARPSRRSISTCGATARAHLKRIPRTTPLDQVESLIRDDGAVVIQDFLSSSQVRSINAELDPVVAQRLPGSDSTDEATKNFVGQHTKRVSDLVGLSRTWRDEVLNDDLFHNVCDHIIARKLGDYWMNSSLLIEIGPGQEAQLLHRDASQWWPFVLMGAGRPPTHTMPIFYINFLVALTDTTATNGATVFVPGSHLDQWEYRDGDDILYGHPVAGGWVGPDETEGGATSSRPTLPIEMRAGDALLLGDRLVHGGGANTTADERRRLVSLSVVSSAFTTEQAGPLFTDLELVRAMPGRVQKLLGFRTMSPAGAPGLWGVQAGDTGEALGLGKLEEGGGEEGR